MNIQTTFPPNTRFRCIEGCGRCCGYMVTVLDGEKAFLDKHGDAVVTGVESMPDVVWQTTSSVAGALKREGGACAFLDEAKRCTIYPDRPLYCRLYPWIRDTYGERQIDADLSCPGIGAGDPVSEKDLQEVLDEEARVARVAEWSDTQRKLFEFAEMMLTRRGMNCRREALAEVYRHLFDDLTRSCRSDRGSPTDLADQFAQCVRELRPPLTACGNIDALPDALDGLADECTEGIGMAESEVVRLKDYLDIWHRRNILFRAAHAHAMASPMPVSLVFWYGQLLADAVKRLCKEIGKSSSGDRVQEAVRSVDGGLRASFMSATVALPLDLGTAEEGE